MSAKSNQSYSKMLAQLQTLIDWFESGEVDLDEAVSKFKQANELIDKMEDYLKTAENKLKKVGK